MKKPLIALAITLVACLASLAGYAPSAQATSGTDTYQFDKANNIVGTGSLNVTFISDGNTPENWLYVVHPVAGCTAKYTIYNVQKSSGGSNTGDILTNWSPTQAKCAPKITLGDNSPNITIAGVSDGGRGPGTYTLSRDAQGITASGLVSAFIQGHTFVYNKADLQYEYVFSPNPANPRAAVVVATITNLQPITNSTNYSATLSVPTIDQPAPITVLATGKTAKPPDSSGLVVSTVDVPPSCNAGPHFTWLICDTIRVGMGVVDWIRDNIIIPFLVEQPLDSGAKDVKPVYLIWSAFRNIASVFFILVFFLVIFGTAIGWDNYNVKKTLPRLVLGAVLVPFSWYVCVIVLDAGNVLGQGIIALTSTLIPPAAIDFTSSLSKLILGGVLIGAGVAATTALATIGFGLVVSMVIAFFTVFFTLVLRKILIIVMIVLSPFAFLAWILPNTTKLFKEWWNNFFKLVMMYPVVMMLFEAGRLFAATAGATAGNNAEKGVTPLFQLVGLTLPLFAVPFAFKWAGTGLNLGRKGIGRGMGALDKKFGKDSEGAKERAETRRDNNARRATDVSNNRIGGKNFGFDSKVLSAARRGFAMKRSGLGGFAGNSNIPILRNNAAKKQVVNRVSSKADSDLAESAAQEKMRKDPQTAQTSKVRIANMAEAQYDKMDDARITEAGLAKKNQAGVALKDITIGGGGATEGAAKLVEEARASGDQHSLLEALKASDGGIDNIEAMIMEEVMKGDQGNSAVVTAGLQRLNTHPSGIHRAQALAQGTIAKITDKDGTVHYRGGAGAGGQNAVVVEDAAGNKSFKMTGPALLGGNARNNAADKWRSSWDKGMKNTMSTDARKSMAQAAVDMSSADMTKYTVLDVERLAAFYDQGRTSDDSTVKKAAIKGASDFSIAAEGVANSRLLTGQTYSDTKGAIAEMGSLSHPAVSAATRDHFKGLIPVPAPEPSIHPTLAGHIVGATSNDPVHASQIKAQIDAERAANSGASALHDNLAERARQRGSLEAADLAAAGAVSRAPLAAGEVAPGAMLAPKMAETFAGNLDQLHLAERAYATDQDYRSKVEDAFLRGKKLPSPPAP